MGEILAQTLSLVSIKEAKSKKGSYMPDSYALGFEIGLFANENIAQQFCDEFFKDDRASIALKIIND